MNQLNDTKHVLYMAKGFTQQYRINYQETFASIAQLTIFCSIARGCSYESLDFYLFIFPSKQMLRVHSLMETLMKTFTCNLLQAIHTHPPNKVFFNSITHSMDLNKFLNLELVFNSMAPLANLVSPLAHMTHWYWYQCSLTLYR